MRSPRISADTLRRLLAAGMAALVLALTMFAASPVAHELLHDDAIPHGDDRCAVVLFASSVAVPLTAIAVPAPNVAWHATPAVVIEEIFLTPVRYLRQPERGPPALG